MGERVPERAMEAAAPVNHDGDRAFTVIAFVLCALSGFVMGLLVQGVIARGLLSAVSTALAGFVGGWVRGVL